MALLVDGLVTLGALPAGAIAKGTAGVKGVVKVTKKIPGAVTKVLAATKKIVKKGNRIKKKVKNALGKPTPAQQARINDIENVINNNAKPHDFEGVPKELRGVGDFWTDGRKMDHVTKMRNSVGPLKTTLRD